MDWTLSAVLFDPYTITRERQNRTQHDRVLFQFFHHPDESPHRVWNDSFLPDPKVIGRVILSRPELQTGTLIYIAVVGIVSSLASRELWNPEGTQKIADLLLHDLVPVLYVVWWFVFGPKAHSPMEACPMVARYPFAYLVYTLVRGRIVGSYPYPFLDVIVSGFGRVLAKALVLLVVFLGIGLIIIAISRRQRRRLTTLQSH